MTQTHLQLIRNATLQINYAGKEILVDPMLASKGSYPAFPGTPNAHLSNPLVALPVHPEDLIHPDAVLVTHLHPDHFDEKAIELLPKETLVFSQNEEDARKISESGFSNVQLLSHSPHLDEIQIHKTSCQHGSDAAYAIPEVANRLGQSCGFVLQTEGAPTIYAIGDTIWIDAIEETLTAYQPDVVVANAGNAQFDGLGPIIMGKEDLLRIHQIVPDAKIIVVHLEALNHCLLSRKELRAFLQDNQMDASVLVPEDGDLIYL